MKSEAKSMGSSTLVQQINKLEQQAKALEPNSVQRELIRNKIISYTDTFLEKLPDYELSPTYYPNGDGKGLNDFTITDEPAPDFDKVLEGIKEHVDQAGINAASGGHLGYIPGGGIYTSSLGDYWADITNRYAGVFYANPGAVRMENKLLRWMSDMVGYPKSAIGNMASGGSIANLIAMVTAREAKNIQSKDISKQVIYLSKQVHHCIEKALHIAGLRECEIRMIELDNNYCMRVDHLKTTIQQDLDRGLRPFLLVASAGTTDTGAIDPLNDLADVAEQHNIWFHVDAAYGGFFLLVESEREKFKGIERSDSVVMDPHKGLFIPYGLGVVLVKQGEKVKNTFTYKANYMQDTFEANDEVSPADVSPELTKHFRGLRLWLPLMIHGVNPFRACLEEKLLLAQYAYQELQKRPGIEVGPAPMLSVVTFRYLPKKGDANKFNADLVKSIHQDGRIFVSSTTIDGKFIIRFAILSFRTHRSTIDFAIQLLEEKIARLEV